jgi:hypothetical protein
MAATIHALGPGSRGQDADDLSACFGATTVAGSRFDDPGEIPAGAPAHLGDLQGTPRFAAVERYCGDPDTDLVAVGIAQADLADSQPAGHSRINDHGTDLLRHMFSPPWRWLKVSGLQWPGPGHRGAGAK